MTVDTAKQAAAFAELHHYLSDEQAQFCDLAFTDPQEAFKHIYLVLLRVMLYSDTKVMVSTRVARALLQIKPVDMQVTNTDGKHCLTLK